MTKSALFVFYGLLKRGAVGAPEHIDLEAGGEFLGPAFLRGDLFDVGGYPGIVEGEGLVTGVLYRLDDLALLTALDEFEDVVPDDPAGSLYRRILRDVLNEAGEPVGQRAWVYWFNQPVHSFPRLKTGNWPLGAGSP
ncbi:gamma-glutamylcyclotransferase [Ponticaulis sp.]|uniref:gamma-glutamylcyclotransferase family protein n=1 Tax=Ponticaulis sp. TaxID=2020902 RepID=UPI000B677BFB|nr:gamma-glutamylcyclotransferase family protein [Ponticaulis sp.]MAI89176.1 gamma-glutamylcyclotransferase [Ponticaulis sp.]OUY01170.1 MAG: hypothetical protein CBB65_01665 [Hyphomonadaceae bacterium TMED5]|tara:strand:+ start:91506 stop:91916 length:411 start_codon:yes stop_codon:yes gene_type:complete